MISLRNIKIIFKKEFLQIMRDKSVLFTNFFLPLFGIPLYFIFTVELASFLIRQETLKIENDVSYKISIVGEFNRKLLDKLRENKSFVINKSEIQLDKQLIDGHNEKYNNYLKIKGDAGAFKTKLKEDKLLLKNKMKILQDAYQEYSLAQENIEKILQESKSDILMKVISNDQGVDEYYIFYSQDKKTSKMAYLYIKKVLVEYELQLINEVKIEKNITEKDLKPMKIHEINVDIAHSSILKSIGVGIGGSIIFLLLIALFNPAINTTLGERDQNTYKVLLMNPVSPIEIFLGKYLNVALQGILTLIPYGLEFIIFYAWGASTRVFQYAPNITFLKLLFLAFGIISAAILISALCFLISSFAKSRQQAQSLMTILMVLFLIPIATVGALDIKLTTLSAFIPLINFPLMTENLLSHSPNYNAQTIALLVNSIVSIFIMWFSLGAFMVQWKGSTETKTMSDLLTMKRRFSSELLPAHGLMAFGIAFLGYVYGGFIFTSLQIELFFTLFVPIIFSLGTVIFIISYSKLDFLKIFILKEHTFQDILKISIGGCLVAGASYALTIGLTQIGIISKLNPMLIEGHNLIAILSNILLFVAVPACCEEMLFRGIIYKSFRRQYTIMISSALSAIFYAIILFSTYKIGYGLIFGLISNYFYEKKGILSSLWLHVVFKMTLLILAYNL